jgi:hypothetical protein
MVITPLHPLAGQLSTISREQPFTKDCIDGVFGSSSAVSWPSRKIAENAPKFTYIQRNVGVSGARVSGASTGSDLA